MKLRIDPSAFSFQGRPIPEHMHQCIREYLVDHVLDPDDFLAAILVNDLRRAVSSADQINLWAIPVYVAYFHDYAPYNCWGSVERVSAWLAAGPAADAIAANGGDEPDGSRGA